MYLKQLANIQANEIGIKFDLMDVAKIFKRTPYLADLKPGGKYVAKDPLGSLEGVPMLLKTLYDGGYIHRLYNCYWQVNERKLERRCI